MATLGHSLEPIEDLLNGIFYFDATSELQVKLYYV